ncbi:response regulator [Reichenbachiella agarivorans]|uniref:Response regulator n=1 Tax=Reichenbachiella agarivorans TaxID=2979464 RepID=A0ABY6CM14_9BACT|nr:response regulator [Reichenbachiella agarivorans]UXP31547.1 response regulator [Reichenbachiella agarivorans]
MSELRVLIVEDELIIARDLQDILKSQGHQVIGIARTAQKALEILKQETPDLILLDIYIKGEQDGIWVAKYLNDHYEIPFLFITSHSDPSTLEEAMQTQPCGYLLKPFEEDDVKVSVQMAVTIHQNRLQEIKNTHSSEEGIIKDSIFIKDKNLFKKIPLKEIYYIQADSNYSLVQTKDRVYTLRVTLKDVEEKLPVEHFERVHKSYVVNLAHIDAINSAYIVVNGQEIPISREVQTQLINRINKI